jgi:hypothetical protein
MATAGMAAAGNAIAGQEKKMPEALPRQGENKPSNKPSNTPSNTPPVNNSKGDNEGSKEGNEENGKEKKSEEFIPQIVRFGYGSEGNLASSIFIMNGNNTPHSGFPGLQGKDAFNKRFIFDSSSEDAIKEVMLKLRNLFW